MRKILCIDDSILIRQKMKEILEVKNCQIFEAENGQEGLNILQAEPSIDVIFCDVNMPVMNGMEFCRNYYLVESNRKIPLFMLTTEGNAELKDMAKKNGVKGWILKPFSENKIDLVLKTLFPSDK